MNDLQEHRRQYTSKDICIYKEINAVTRTKIKDAKEIYFEEKSKEKKEKIHDLFDLHEKVSEIYRIKIRCTVKQKIATTMATTIGRCAAPLPPPHPTVTTKTLVTSAVTFRMPSLNLPNRTTDKCEQRRCNKL